MKRKGGREGGANITDAEGNEESRELGPQDIVRQDRHVENSHEEPRTPGRRKLRVLLRG